MSDGGAVWIWATAILAISVGFAVGFLVAYVAVLKDGNAQKLRKDLEAQKAEFETYRGRVDDHFVRTSELFQDMTRQYGALYEHLAGGAQSLCSDRLVTHRPSVPESMPMVEHKVAGPSDRPEPVAATPEPAPSDEAKPVPDIQEESQAETARTEAESNAGTTTKHSHAQVDADEAEMEGFAPRPEAATLREATTAQATTAVPDSGVDGDEPEHKRHLH